MFYVGVGASIFTFVKTCVERYGSYLILDQSSVAAGYIDLGVVCFVCFVYESGQGFTFAVFLVVFQELLSVPHCLSCTGIVFRSWLGVVSSLGHRLRVMRS
jgi:hypothetical protein